MERFYLTSIKTCIKSGCLLFVAGILIVLAVRAAEWSVIGGVVAIVIGAVVYGRSLARAGFDAALVRLSQYSRTRSLLILLGALLLNGFGYIALSVIGYLGLGLALDLSRIIALIAALVFLPMSLLIITTSRD